VLSHSTLLAPLPCRFSTRSTHRRPITSPKFPSPAPSRGIGATVPPPPRKERLPPSIAGRSRKSERQITMQATILANSALRAPAVPAAQCKGSANATVARFTQGTGTALQTKQVGDLPAVASGTSILYASPDARATGATHVEGDGEGSRCRGGFRQHNPPPRSDLPGYPRRPAPCARAVDAEPRTRPRPPPVAPPLDRSGPPPSSRAPARPPPPPAPPTRSSPAPAPPRSPGACPWSSSRAVSGSA